MIHDPLNESSEDWIVSYGPSGELRNYQFGLDLMSKVGFYIDSNLEGFSICSSVNGGTYVFNSFAV